MTSYAKVILGILLFAASATRGQTTTNTNCTVNGSNANCTSTSTDNSAQQQRADETGQQLGEAPASGIALAMQTYARNKWVKNYCAGHPGSNWHWPQNSDGALFASGHCPTDAEVGAVAVNEFMAHHRKYIKCQENSDALDAYLTFHRLDPRIEKSYERAYKDLKKDGRLQLYRN
jgi:hypothetical protein